MFKKCNSLNEFYGRHLEKYLPEYAFLSFCSCFILNCLIYFVTQHLMAGEYHYDFTSSIDRKIPFIPWWVSIYVLSFAFWVINYALTAKKSSKEDWYKFVTADMTARVVCGIIFILLPTTNVRPEIDGNTIWDMAMRLIYFFDEPYNLFPSIHCLASWMCFIGIRKRDNVSTLYKWVSAIFALLICASTQFTKQHYLVDAISGIALAEICYFVARNTRGYNYIMKIFDKVNEKVLGYGIFKEE